MKLTSRFYWKEYPEVTDVVMVKVITVNKTSLYVRLLEYNNLEGTIILTENESRHLHKVTRTNKEEQAVVLHVDKEKGFCELSKHRVSATQAKICSERFKKANKLNTLLRRVADILEYDTNEQLEELYMKTVWHFEKKHKSKTEAYDIFQQSVIYPSVFDECDLDERTKDVLLANIRHKFFSPIVNLHAYIKCSCCGYEGVDAVRAALTAGMDLSTEELPIDITLVAPPRYVMKMSTTKIAEGLEILRTAIETIRNKIIEFDGKLKVIESPKLTTPSDEANLARRLERAKAENQEVDGDDDEDQLGMKFDIEKEFSHLFTGVDILSDNEDNGDEE